MHTRISTLSSAIIIGIVLGAAQQLNAQTTTYINSARPFRGPQAYKADDSDVIFYVESGGRHVTAISPDGKILWHRDPFVDANLTSYRFEKPVIVFIGKPNDWMIKNRKGRFIQIGFNSSQAGIMNVANGDFVFMGQD